MEKKGLFNYLILDVQFRDAQNYTDWALMMQYNLHTMKVPISDFMSAFALEYQKQRDRRNLFHFAMRLHPEFEVLRVSILHQHPLPSLTEAVAEFTSEETHLRILSTSATLVFTLLSGIVSILT